MMHQSASHRAGLQAAVVGAIVLGLGTSALAGSPGDGKMTKWRVIYNNDGSFWYTGKGADGNTVSGEAAKAPMTKEELIGEVVRPLEGTGVDTLILRMTLGYDLLAYDTKVGQVFADGVPTQRSVYYENGRLHINHFLKEGIDSWAVVIEAGQKQGLRMFGGVRMNHIYEAGGAALVDGTKASRWYVEHQELRIGEGCTTCGEGRNCFGMDYMKEGVRDYWFGLINEMVRRYELDGFEMDFMRGPHFFKQAELEEGLARMTRFVRRVKGLLEEVGAGRGRRMELGVRVPPTLAGGRKIGLDAATWMKEGIVDIVAPSNFMRADMNIPVAEFVQAASGTSCATVPVIDTPTPILPVMALRAVVQHYAKSGANGFYFFNYHRMPYQRGVPWSDKRLVSLASEPDALARESKSYEMTRAARGGEASVDLPAQLPLVAPGDGKEAALPVFVDEGAPEEGEAPPFVRMRVDFRPPIGLDDIEVALNGRALAVNRANTPPVTHSHIFDLYPDHPHADNRFETLNDGRNVLVFRLKKPYEEPVQVVYLRFKVGYEGSDW